MNEAARLHEAAMDELDAAEMCADKGDSAGALEHSRSAFELEKQAAELLRGERDFEPSRSILFRSAASIAFEINAFREAERLAAEGLAGNPAGEIADELRQLLKDAIYRQSRAETGAPVTDERLRIRLDGRSIGYGVVDAETFTRTIQNAFRLLARTYDRVSGAAFAGRKTKKNTIDQYIGTMAPSSFEVDVLIGKLGDGGFPELSLASKTVEEVIECFEIIQHDNDSLIRERIPDPDYRANFLALARELMPDGENVTSISFEGVIRRSVRRVEVTRKRETIKLPVPTAVGGVKIRKIIQGTLRYANSLADAHEVVLVGANGRSPKIVVPETMMEDIVRPRWGQEVSMAVWEHPKNKGRSRKAEFIAFE